MAVKKHNRRWSMAPVEALLLVVDNNGPTMMARIGFMQALAYARSKSDPGAG
jgi:hypothetical protein